MKDRSDLVVISGYFDPIHMGHLEYIEKAKKLGKELIVIVNNDKQAKLKKGRSFISQEERVLILEKIKGVDRVVLSIDGEKSVCKTLEKIAKENLKKKMIFAQGGDRKNIEIPEAKTAKKYKIKMVDNLGVKIQSSSNLIGKLRYLEIGKKPWGAYYVLEEAKNFKVKKIEVEPKGSLSLQSHKKRCEFWVVVEGVGHAIKKDKKKILKKGDTLFLEKKEKHQMSNLSNKKLIFIEVQLGEYLGEDDIIRYEDKYNRI